MYFNSSLGKPGAVTFRVGGLAHEKNVHTSSHTRFHTKSHLDLGCQRVDLMGQHLAVGLELRQVHVLLGGQGGHDMEGRLLHLRGAHA